ncbi:MAG: HIT family protein [Acidimicrobiales bacterium]|nr:HIT family protein [Hyphomonadaceae bacterium]RZV43892.1 MAG: HIT family protein [Acidimicrobiales bacterium]
MARPLVSPVFKLHPDLARDGIPIGDFPLSRLLMINDAAYPWFVLVPRVPDIKDAYQLEPEQHQHLTEESRALCNALMSAFNGEKMNVAALGNMTPQLHVHHIVRFKNDPAWPGPIWGVQPMTPMTEVQIAVRRGLLKPYLPDLSP